MPDKVREIVQMAMKIYRNESDSKVKTFDAVKKRIANDINNEGIFFPMLYPEDVIFTQLDPDIHRYRIDIRIPYYDNFKPKKEKK